MKKRMLQLLIVLVMTLSSACLKTEQSAKVKSEADSGQKSEKADSKAHSYGAWYCPDNLNGFPPTDIKEWEHVPVVNGRLATKEETQNGESLIFVDTEEYPDAKALDITMPKLATYYNDYTKREDLIIVIQALKIGNDSIVGFRFLNGGNGSARLNEVKFLSDSERKKIPSGRFVTLDVKINAAEDVVWDVLTNPDHAEALQQEKWTKNLPELDWSKKSNLNYHYAKAGNITSTYANKLFGNYYIQNDFDRRGYTEKIFVHQNEEDGFTEMKVVFGPYAEDFEDQKKDLKNWSQLVKDVSEKQK